MLRFPYQTEPLTGPAPPSLPPGTLVRWRPLVPVTIVGPGGLQRDFGRAILDDASDDTVFPLDVAFGIGVRLHPDTGHRVRWRGQLHALRFGQVELVLADNHTTWHWPAMIGFSPAPLRYPLLGPGWLLAIHGCPLPGSRSGGRVGDQPHLPGHLHVGQRKSENVLLRSC